MWCSNTVRNDPQYTEKKNNFISLAWRWNNDDRFCKTKRPPWCILLFTLILCALYLFVSEKDLSLSCHLSGPEHSCCATISWWAFCLFMVPFRDLKIAWANFWRRLKDKLLKSAPVWPSACHCGDQPAGFSVWKWGLEAADDVPLLQSFSGGLQNKGL